MSISRKNTVVIDFNILPQRPDAAKVYQFLDKEIKVQLVDIENIQLHNIKNCVYIEVKDSEIAARYQRMHNNRHVIFHGEIGFKIPVYVDSEVIPVRVHDLPPSMKHTTVIEFLQNYGEVQSVTRERWKKFFPGVYNGVRILHMKIKQPIPSVVSIAGHSTLITYPGQPRKTNPKQTCLETPIITNKTTITQTCTAIASSEHPSTSNATTIPLSDDNIPLHNTNDFPPIIPKQQESTTTSLPTAPTGQEAQKQNTNNSDNDDDKDDADDSGSSSSHETNEGNNKRRLSSKRIKERKMHSSQGSLVSGQRNSDGRSKEIGTLQSSEKKFKSDFKKN